MGFVERLRALDVQSATTIALESMKYLLRFTGDNDFGKKFDMECKRLLAARPTAVVLYNSIERIRKRKNSQTIKSVIKELQESKSKAARNASKIFNKKSVVLTHCHSSFVVEALVKNKTKINEVIVTETRPREQGVITARELIKNGIRVSFIIDSAISDFIGKADLVVVGADALRKEGLINKVGTHPLALVANENKKPFYVITSSFTFDKRQKIIMEQRPASELQHKHLNGARIFNPAFDITPWKYVRTVVTETGIIKPSRLKRLVK